MSDTTKRYVLPKGHSFFSTISKSKQYLDDPISFVEKTFAQFSDTYTATLKPHSKFIITRNGDFINYILKEHHKNYQKSKLSTESATRFFGKGLLFANGDYWLRQRRLIQPAFHREKLQGLNEIITNSIKDSLEKFHVGENIDICPVIHKLAFDILIKSLFDINLSRDIMDEIDSIFTEILDFLNKDVNQPYVRLLYPLNGAKTLALIKSKRLREILRNIIRDRKQENKSYSDLLDMLINSRYEETGESMNEDQIIDELLIIIFAGHDTTAISISWLLYLLSLNPIALEKLTQTISNTNEQDCLQNELIKANIYEGMRLYPAAWMTERVALEDDAFGEYSYPKNTVMIINFYFLHHDKKVWKEAEAFIPERFIENPNLLKSKNYFPFGAGPRMCIGNNFAMTEMCFFIYLFLQKFEISATGQVPKMKPVMTLRADRILLNIKRKVS